MGSIGIVGESFITTLGEREIEGSKLSWFFNYDFGGSIPVALVSHFNVLSMYWPAHKVKGAEKRMGVQQQGEGGQSAIEEGPPKADNDKGMGVAQGLAPVKLGLDDCIIDKSKHQTLKEQRQFFQIEMTRMARAGNDKDDGWAFMAKTEATNLEKTEQLDVYSRNVPWSEANQLRSVVKTEFALDDIFDYLCTGSVTKLWKESGETEVQRSAMNSKGTFLFRKREADTFIRILYQTMPLPW